MLFDYSNLVFQITCLETMSVVPQRGGGTLCEIMMP